MRVWYFLIQSVVWPIAWVTLRAFFKIEITGRKNLTRVKKPLLIVSNHRTLYDEFFVGLALPWLSGLFPLRFMAGLILLNGTIIPFLAKIRVLPIIYFLTGAFSSRRGEGIDKAVQTPVNLLSRGQTVVIFPEGKIKKSGLGDFRDGASAVALRSGAQILPMFIERKGWVIRLAIGEPFYLKAHKVEYGTILLKEAVEKLAIQR